MEKKKVFVVTKKMSKRKTRKILQNIRSSKLIFSQLVLVKDGHGGAVAKTQKVLVDLSWLYVKDK